MIRCEIVAVVGRNAFCSIEDLLGHLDSLEKEIIPPRYGQTIITYQTLPQNYFA